jgi:hypothetical protein
MSEQDRPYLSAEIVGDNISMKVPDDPIIGRILLEHLRHAIELRELNSAVEMRNKMKAIQSNGTGVQLSDALALKRLKHGSN